MAETNTGIKPKPQINDQYWFDRSKEMVDASVGSRNEASAKLQRLVVWLWGIYTASTAVGAYFEGGFPLTLVAIIIMGAPSIVLLVAYWLATRAQFPVGSRNFDPRSPSQIKEAYFSMVGVKDRRMKIASWGAFLGCISVGLAIWIAPMLRKLPPGDFDCVIEMDGRNAVVIVAGNFPPSVKVLFEVKGGDRANVTFNKAQALSMASGELHVSIPVRQEGSTYDVSATWQETADVKKTLSKKIRPK